jgi:cell division transport system ATP-binding protein
LDSTAPIIDAQNLVLAYADRIVLQDVTFALQPGQFTYVIGRTGSGKSTLLRALYADLKPKGGTLGIAGAAVDKIGERDIPFLRRKLGIVFQDFQLLPDRSVADNILFAMQATGWKDKAKMKERLTNVLMMVGLASRAGSLPHQLSGGEQQRTAIARALVNEPLLLIADEPTGNLDPEVTEHIMEILLKINKSGTAVVMATHNYDLIAKMPARVLECKDAQLLEKQRV